MKNNKNNLAAHKWRTKETSLSDTIESKPYTKVRKSFSRFRNYLPKAIQESPDPLNIEDVESQKFMRVHCVDDEQMEIYAFSRELQLWDGESLLVVSAVTGAGLLLSPSYPALILFILISLLTALKYIYGRTMPNRLIILDRKRGLVTYPGFMWSKAIQTPFEHLPAAINRIAGFYWVTGSFDALHFVAYHPNTISSTFLGVGKEYKTWNMFVWYMDKNRPLPPGSAFDPYRQKDFERRKAEGFPRPLYPSSIPTPEATPEQQREREKYWKDPSGAKH